MFGGKIISVEKIGRHHDVAHLRFELFCFGPLPVFIPTLQVVWSRATICGEDLFGSIGRWELARVATRAGLGKNSLTVVDACDVSSIVRIAVVEILRTVRRCAQLVRRRSLEKEERHIDGLRFSRL